MYTRVTCLLIAICVIQIDAMPVDRYSMTSSRSSQHGFRNNFNRPYEPRAYSSPYDYRSKYEYQSKPNDHFIHEQMRIEARRYDQRNPNQPMIPFQNPIHMPPMPYTPSRQYPPSMPYHPHMMTPSLVDHNPDLSNEMRRQAEYNREAMRQPNKNNQMSDAMTQFGMNLDMNGNKDIMGQFQANFDSKKPFEKTYDFEMFKPVPDSQTVRLETPAVPKTQTVRLETPTAPKTQTINNAKESASTDGASAINSEEKDDNKTAIVNDDIDDKSLKDIDDDNSAEQVKDD